MGALGAFYQADKQRKDDGTDNSHNDGVNQPTLSRKAQRAHNESTHDGTDDANNDVTNRAKAATLHQLASNESGDESYDNPPNNDMPNLL